MSKSRPKVLVIPLDWGLGHATRCVPIISNLLSIGCTVEIAASGPQKVLLNQEFPLLTIVEMEGYKINYSKKWLFFHLMLQSVKITKAVKKEHLALRKIIAERYIDWVIADNRYGCYSCNIVSTIITHQLRVKMPAYLRFAESLLQTILYRYINRFNNCWVPDFAENTLSLSGKLGHPALKPAIPVWYTGWLSRFNNSFATQHFKYKCIIVLSGPEPLRTIFETKLVEQLNNIRHSIVLARGLPSGGAKLNLPPNVEVYNHLATAQLQQKIKESEFLISRSGYSTLMDAFTLQKKCILVPTPGQTEQEYLASYLYQKQMALVYSQYSFDVAVAISVAENYPFQPQPSLPGNSLRYAIENVLNRHFGGFNVNDAITGI